MKYLSSGVGDGFDLGTLQIMIDCFIENDESGPHSPEGWALSHILNYCHSQAIPFTLVSLPEHGFYLKRGTIDGIIPDEMKAAFGM